MYAGPAWAAPSTVQFVMQVEAAMGSVSKGVVRNFMEVFVPVFAFL